MVKVDIEFKPDSIDVNVTDITEETAVTLKPIKTNGIVQGVDVSVLVTPGA
jgi:hypothetical protein